MQSGRTRSFDPLEGCGGCETDPRTRSIHREVCEARVPTGHPKLQRLQNGSHEDADQCDDAAVTGMADSEDQPQE